MPQQMPHRAKAPIPFLYASNPAPYKSWLIDRVHATQKVVDCPTFSGTNYLDRSEMRHVLSNSRRVEER